MKCHFCQQPVSPDSPGTFKLITGWVEVRTQGGGHAVAMPGPPQAFAHRHCVERAKRGGDQQSLFG